MFYFLQGRQHCWGGRDHDVHRLSALVSLPQVQIVLFLWIDILSILLQGGAEDEVQEPVLPTGALQGN